eukprot:CFRG1029T1
MTARKAAKGFGFGLVAAAASLAVYYNLDQEDADRVRNGLDKLEHKMERQVEKIENKANKLTDETKAVGHDIAEKTTEFAHQASDVTSDIVHKAEDKLHGASEKVEDIVHDISDSAKDLYKTAASSIPKPTTTRSEDLVSSSSPSPPPGSLSSYDRSNILPASLPAEASLKPPTSRTPPVDESIATVATLVAMNVGIMAFCGLAK